LFLPWKTTITTTTKTIFYKNKEHDFHIKLKHLSKMNLTKEHIERIVKSTTTVSRLILFFLLFSLLNFWLFLKKETRISRNPRRTFLNILKSRRRRRRTGQKREQTKLVGRLPQLNCKYDPIRFDTNILQQGLLSQRMPHSVFALLRSAKWNKKR